MRRRVAATLALLVTACAGPGYDFEDLPDRPIALVYRNMTEAEQAADAYDKAEKRLRVARTGVPIRGRPNTLDVDDIAQAFGVYGTSEDRAAANLGRVALLHPRTGEIETVDWAPRGSRPLDWSADHQRLLFVKLRRGLPHIYERDFRTGDVRPITHARRRHLDACYCGEDGLIFAAITTSGRSQLFLRRAGGGKPVAVTEGPGDYAPSCTPDGRRVVWTGRGVEGESIRSLDLEDPEAEPTLLTRGRHPGVTPDGAWILYSALTRDGWKVWRMRIDGTGRHPLGRGPEWEHQPNVSGDGRFAVYVSTFDKHEIGFKLWVRPLDGDADRPLPIDGEALHPVW